MRLQQEPLPAAVHHASRAGNAVGWGALAKVWRLSFQAAPSERMICHADLDAFGIAGQHSTPYKPVGPTGAQGPQGFYTPFTPHLGRPHPKQLAVSRHLAIQTYQLTAIS